MEGTAQCEDCGADLLPGSPPEAPPRVDLSEEKDVKLVPARIFTGSTAPMDAELARNILQTQGIPSTIRVRVSRTRSPWRKCTCSCAKRTPAHAERVLQEFLDTEVPPPLEDPDVAEGK